jgi:hypothetical protein
LEANDSERPPLRPGTRDAENVFPELIEIFTELGETLGSPRNWALDDDGRPSQLVELTTSAGPWYDMRRLGSAGALGPLQMPYFDLGPPLRSGKTKLPLRDVDPARAEEVQQIAWEIDLWGRSLGAIARERDAATRPGHGVGLDQQRTKLKREREQGRQSLRELGVLPWIAWENGQVAKNWWAQPAFWSDWHRWSEESESSRLRSADVAQELQECLAHAGTVLDLVDRSMRSGKLDRPKGEAWIDVALAREHARRLRTGLHRLMAARVDGTPD